MIVGIFDQGHRDIAKPSTVKPATNQVGTMPDYNPELLDTGSVGPANDVLKNGLATKLHKRVGEPGRHCPEPRPVPSSENETLIYLAHLQSSEGKRAE